MIFEQRIMYQSNNKHLKIQHLAHLGLGYNINKKTKKCTEITSGT